MKSAQMLNWDALGSESIVMFNKIVNCRLYLYNNHLLQEIRFVRFHSWEVLK